MAAGNAPVSHPCRVISMIPALSVMLLLTAAIMLSGCGTQAIVVTEAAITDDPKKHVVGWTADEAPQLVFSPEDEEVTLRALFEFNYRGVYEWYKVEWISPDGSPYKVVSLRTDFGSHRDIKASLKIRGKMASRLPGVWRTRLWLIGREGAPDRLLVSRLFRIAEPTEKMIQAGLTPVDPPKAGAPRPLAKAGAPAGAVASSPPPKPAATPRVSLAPSVKNSKVSTDILPATKTTPTAPASPAASSPGFPVLAPLAVLLPESAVAPPATSTPEPTPVPASAASSSGATTPKPGVPATGLAAAPKPVKSPPTQRATQPPSPGAGVLSLSLSSTPGKGPLKPSRGPHSYQGCPPIYYPPGPGCIEKAPEE